MDAPTNTYFAIQLLRLENPHNAIQDVFFASRKIRKFFRRLEVLDTFSMGSGCFLRCRTDRTDMLDILQGVQTGGRGVVVLSNGTYVANVGGRHGPVSTLGMHAEIKEGLQRMYKGTKIKGWEAQFSAKSVR